MTNFDDVTNENMKEHNPDWSEIPDHSCISLLTRASESWKTNAFLNLIIHQPDIYKVHLNGKDPSEAKYQLLINKGKSTGLKNFNDSKVFIKYLKDMDMYKNIGEYNLNEKQKILILLDDLIADILSNKKSSRIVTE